jgi:hypothetical protein
MDAFESRRQSQIGVPLAQSASNDVPGSDGDSFNTGGVSEASGIERQFADLAGEQGGVLMVDCEQPQVVLQVAPHAGAEDRRVELAYVSDYDVDGPWIALGSLFEVRVVTTETESVPASVSALGPLTGTLTVRGLSALESERGVLLLNALDDRRWREVGGVARLPDGTLRVENAGVGVYVVALRVADLPFRQYAPGVVR